VEVNCVTHFKVPQGNAHLDHRFILKRKCPKLAYLHLKRCESSSAEIISHFNTLEICSDRINSPFSHIFAHCDCTIKNVNSCTRFSSRSILFGFCFRKVRDVVSLIVLVHADEDQSVRSVPLPAADRSAVQPARTGGAGLASVRNISPFGRISPPLFWIEECIENCLECLRLDFFVFILDLTKKPGAGPHPGPPRDPSVSSVPPPGRRFLEP